MVVPVIGVIGASSSSDEDGLKELEGVRVQVAETGLEGSVEEKERDFTLVSSTTLAPDD